MLTSRLRAVAILECALLLASCSDTSSPTGPEDPTDDPTDPGDGGSTVQFDSEAPPGDSARSFLDDRRFTVLRLEVDYMEGYEPSTEALDSLRATLDTHLSKSSIQISNPTQIPAEGEDPYSSDQIRGLEDEHRDHYTRAESDTVHAHFLILDGFLFSTESMPMRT
ncbi:MAG: hypothetical protein BRD41_03870 [Bacteroidetes bacterium QS_1_63_11]|nr:MAG: hypothetical protein BRD41_03870 [Bacteroidetes bacterium QS_1_63_11]